jgi:DNA-directed RNA polymerase I subunit RPA1
MFSVTFEELLEAIKKTVYQKLNYIIQLEMRRAGSVVIQRPTNENSGTSSKPLNDDNDTEGANPPPGEKGNQKSKNIGFESDDDDDDDDEIDDVEQGTLRLGRKEEVSSYDNAADDSDDDERHAEPAQVAEPEKKRVKSGRSLSDKSFHYSEKEGWIEMHITYPVSSRKLLMVQLAEQAAKKANVRETKDIARAYAIECDVDGDKRFAIQTEGVNFEAAWALEAITDTPSIKSNDIWKILCTYGVEAARHSIVTEIVDVFGVYGINVNPRHLSLIADFMTRNGSYVPMNRMGITNCPSPFLQMSFETTCTFLSQAAQDGSTEHLESSSARIVTGSVPKVGTGCFDIMFPLAV